MIVRMLRNVFSGRSPLPAPAVDLREDAIPHLPPLTHPDKADIPTFHTPFFWSLRIPQLEFAAKVDQLKPDVEAGFHSADNFITWGRNLSALSDQVFVRAWDANCESNADRAILWRRYVLACAAYHCVQLEGDFVECGAYTGVGMKTVMDYLGGTSFPRTFWGYDRFVHDASMANQKMQDLGAGLEERVRAKFADYPQVNLVSGSIPESFDGQMPERIAYLHIDLNHAEPEIAALDHLFDRIVPGGMLILDDYEWAGVYRDQKLAEDRWFEARRYRVMPLPTGQGLVIKR